MINEDAILRQRVSYIVLWTVILLEIFFLYRDVFVWMKMAWFTYPPDRFGLYVPIIFLCIFLFRLVKKPDVSFESNPSGLTIIIVAIFIFLIGFAADVHIIQAFSLIIGAFGMVVYLMGSEWGKIMLFPFTFLILMLPTISFLIESSFGVLLRNLITVMSGTVLGLIDGKWKMAQDVLYLNDISVPIKYYRDSISSPLALLIQVFIAAEFIFIKNRSKFLFTALLWVVLVTAAHSVFIVTMVWAFEHDYFNDSKTIWDNKEWLPALILILILISIGFMLKALKRRSNIRNERK